jgi:fatty acid-binding protein DegV
LIGIKEGKIEPVGIKIGAKDIPTALFKELEGKAKKIEKSGGKIKVAITHGDDLESANRLKEMIENNLQNVEVVFVNIIDDILGAILGPGTLILSGEF